MATLGEEASDRNHNHYIAFKGERTTRSDPPPVQFRYAKLTAVKCKVHLLGLTKHHYKLYIHINITPPRWLGVGTGITAFGAHPS